MVRGRPIPGTSTAPIARRTEPNVKLTDSNLPSEIVGRKTFGVQWSGFVTPTQSGDFILGVRCQGFARLTVEGKQVAVGIRWRRWILCGRWSVHLEKGHKIPLNISNGSTNGTPTPN